MEENNQQQEAPKQEQPQQEPAQTADSQPAGEDKDIQENKLIAALSYLWIISIIVLLVKKDSKFAHFHAKQGLVLFIGSMIASFIPVLGWFILNPIIMILAIIGLIQALMGKYWRVPLVADLAEKINL